MKKVFGLLVVILTTLVLVSCNSDKTSGTINMAINYNGNQFITYQGSAIYESKVNKKVYNRKDLLPVWEALQDKLDVKFNDVASSSDESTDKAFDNAESRLFKNIDVINGTGQKILKSSNSFVDISKHLDKMPHFSQYLLDNPSVRVSLTADDGGIYFTPYFDGENEAEQMFLTRIDWINKVLNTATTGDTTTAAPINYTKIVTKQDYTATVAKAGGGTIAVTKQNQTNIIDQLKALGAVATGNDYLQTFRNYIAAQYSTSIGTVYTTPAEIFTSSSASYDSDELVALMYVVKSNPALLSADSTEKLTQESIQVMIPREAKPSRLRNLYRGLEMFGVRGVHSRYQWLYMDQNEKLVDTRTEEKTFNAANALSTLYDDKLVLENPDSPKDTNWATTYLKKANGFLMFDFNATQTALSGDGQKVDPNYQFEAILPPVCDWQSNGSYFHFTESVRAVKNEAWGITKTAEGNSKKLDKIIDLFDGMYDYSSRESVGSINLYGPVEWSDGTIEYNGVQIPKISNLFREEMKELASNKHIDYLRKFVGATLPIGHIRGMGLEFQTLTDQGKAGIERLNRASKENVFKLAGVCTESATNKWYQLVPTFLPLNADETDAIANNIKLWEKWDDVNLTVLMKDGISGTYVDYYNSLKDKYISVFEKSYNDAYKRAQKTK